MKIGGTKNLCNFLYLSEVRINALMFLGTFVLVAFNRFD